MMLSRKESSYVNVTHSVASEVNIYCLEFQVVLPFCVTNIHSMLSED